MKRKTVLLLIFLVAILACHRSPSGKYKPGYNMIEQSKTIGDTAYFSIDLQYPVFSETNSSQNYGLDALNKAMETFLDTAARYYWGTDEDGARQIIEETGTHGKFELTNRYEILSKTEKLISIKFETYSYALGAHGFTAIHNFNFDVKTGKFLKLTDFVNLGSSENLEILNKLLLKQFENPEGCFDKDPVVVQDYEKFGIDSKSLVFYFEAYELGAYYCGGSVIKIPIAEIKEAGIWVFPENSENEKPV